MRRYKWDEKRKKPKRPIKMGLGARASGMAGRVQRSLDRVFKIKAPQVKYDPGHF